MALFSRGGAAARDLGQWAVRGMARPANAPLASLPTLATDMTEPHGPPSRTGTQPDAL